MELTAEQMRSLPGFFKQIHDPRRAQGRRHYVPVVLAIAAGAVLCGIRGYKAIADWAQALSPTARDRFGCRFSRRKDSVPSESTIRNVLIRINPVELDQALQAWNAQYGVTDESLAIDGKTITADALLTQRKLARYIVKQRAAHYHFTAKNNQKKLFGEISSFFENVSWQPDHTTHDKFAHGRIETRKIWVTTELNKYLNFPHVAQAFKIERITYRKNGKIHALSRTESPIKLAR